MNQLHHHKSITLRLAAGLSLALVALVYLILVQAGRASAHAGYERSEPAEDSVVAESPARVDIWFGQEMARSGGLPKVEVANQAGDLLADQTVLDDADRTHVYIDLPPALPDGRYTVMWYNVSDEDGEEAQGAFHFYVGSGPQQTEPGASGTPSPAPTATTPTNANKSGGDGDGAPWWLVVAVGIAGIVAGGAGGILAGRGRSERR